ncbi:MAG: class I SAM-dependent methyltransferase [Opitutaceae bacterium]|nr:class I SAM-dependent methyltransferase [Opitutaceae bacterium]
MSASPHDPAPDEAHNTHQRAYYQARRPATMLPVTTPYATRHFEEAALAVGLKPADRVLELGAGMGRFSIQFAKHNHPLTAVELSPDLAGICRDTLSPHPSAEVRVADAVAPTDDLIGRFDIVAGFFFLHHLPALDTCFDGARRCVRPEGRFVFVEPNPLNPLYYFQITLTPGMSWKSERGIFQMRHRVIARIAARAGFTDIRAHFYGSVPRSIYNRLAVPGLERTPEYLVPRSLRPFVVFTGTAR